jgi:hypothetical protein
MSASFDELCAEQMINEFGSLEEYEAALEARDVHEDYLQEIADEIGADLYTDAWAVATTDYNAPAEQEIMDNLPLTKRALAM